MIKMDSFLDMLLILTALLGVSLIVGGFYFSGSVITLSASVVYIVRREHNNGKKNG